jgi:hypothetical protein
MPSNNLQRKILERNLKTWLSVLRQLRLVIDVIWERKAGEQIVILTLVSQRSSDENPVTNYELRVYGGSRKAYPYLEQTLFNTAGKAIFLG